MDDRPIVFNTKKEDLDQMSFGDLILFVASATTFLSLETHLSKDLDEEAKEDSIKRMICVDILLSYAKDLLNQRS